MGAGQPSPGEVCSLPRVLILAADAALRGALQGALQTSGHGGSAAFHPLAAAPCSPARPRPTFVAEVVPCASATQALAVVEAAAAGSRPFAVAFVEDGPAVDPSLPGRLRGVDPLLEMVLVGGSAAPDLAALHAAVPPASKLAFLPRSFRDHDVAQLAHSLCAKWRVERQLRVSEARLATCTRLGALGNWEWNLRTGEARWSASLARLLGLRDGGGPVELLWERVHPEDRARVRGEMGRAAHERSSQSLEYRIVKPGVGVRHLRQESVPGLGGPDGETWAVCAVQDVTERHGVESSIRSLAYLDPLTRLPNRSFVSEYLHKALLLARRHDRLAALLHVDLDGFKRVNDTLGHGAGDRVLREVASRLESCVRESDCVVHDDGGLSSLAARGGDTVARFGADEFLLILTEVADAADADVVADRVLTRLAAPVRVDGREVTVSASIGVAVFPEHAADEDLLLRNAALAMHSAKRRGRNTWARYSPVLSPARGVDRLNLESALRQALECAGLEIHYQPKVHADGLTLAGAEALLRWPHLELGNIPPSTFVPIAEESGLIVPLGEWVLRSVCEQIGRWRGEGRHVVPVSVNVSAQQVRDHALVAKIRRILAETQVGPGELEFEITESVLMEESGGDHDPLRELRAMGSIVSMDDFGTGYSSLSYLKRLPIDVVKIDRSFVRDILVEEDDQVILRAIVTMAHQLRLRIVAEGVESEEQLDLLTAMGCDEIQGYVISPPLDHAVFAERFLAAPRMAVG